MKATKNAPTRTANSDQGATKGLSSNSKGTTPTVKIKIDRRTYGKVAVNTHTNIYKYLNIHSTPVSSDPVNPTIIRELLKLFSDLSDVAVITKYAQPEIRRDLYETV